jgi:hypothetical protein
LPVLSWLLSCIWSEYLAEIYPEPSARARALDAIRVHTSAPCARCPGDPTPHAEDAVAILEHGHRIPNPRRNRPILKQPFQGSPPGRKHDPVTGTSRARDERRRNLRRGDPHYFPLPVRSDELELYHPTGISTVGEGPSYAVKIATITVWDNITTAGDPPTVELDAKPVPPGKHPRPAACGTRTAGIAASIGTVGPSAAGVTVRHRLDEAIGDAAAPDAEAIDRREERASAKRRRQGEKRAALGNETPLTTCRLRPPSDAAAHSRVYDVRELAEAAGGAGDRALHARNRLLDDGNHVVTEAISQVAGVGVRRVFTVAQATTLKPEAKRRTVGGEERAHRPEPRRTER